MPSRISIFFRNLLRKGGVEQALDNELQSAVELLTQEKMNQGLSLAEARRQALIELGGVEQVKEEVRAIRSGILLETFAQDLHYAVRMLLKSPAFACIAIFTLALGIGVNTTIFTAFDALVLRPRAVEDPDHLAFVFRTTPGEPHGRFSYPDYLYYRDHSKSFSDLALFAFGMVVTSSDLPSVGNVSPPHVARAIGFQLPQFLQGSAQPISCFFVSGNYFSMLGAVPLYGRLLLPEDDQISSPAVALISGNFWQQQFHSEPKIVGSVLHLNGVAFTVVGITPVDYVGTAPEVPAFWAPVAARVHLGSLSPQDMESRHVIVGEPQGRLNASTSFSDARAELGVLAAQLQLAHPEDDRHEGVTVVSGRNDLALLDPTEWALIVASMIAVALLLLIACANVASLLLARAITRRKEIAVRLALGAGRWRLVRQLLTESILLALLAGAVALPLSGWMLRILLGEIASILPSFWGALALQVNPDIRIFAYTFLVSCAAGIAFGLAPALQASNVDVNSGLKEAGSAFGKQMNRSRLRGFLVAGQITACVVLLINSVLLLRGSQRALTIDPGFDRQRVAEMEMSNPAALHFAHQRLLQTNRDVVREIASLPGVLSVAQASRGPTGSARWVKLSPVDIAPSSSPNSASEPPEVGYSYVTPNYFETLSIPILRGRIFTASESEVQAPVAIISEATARRFWPGEDPIGKRLRIGSKEKLNFPGEKDPFISDSEVVGIARDVHSLDLREPDPSYLYLPLSRDRQWTGTLLARTAVAPETLLPSFGQMFHRVSPDLPVLGASLQSMISMDLHFVISRVGGVLASIVGALGLLLACLGVYGMVSHSVAQKTREIGIRVALGARRGQVFRHVMMDSFRPIFGGMAVGIVVSAGISRLFAATLFGLSPVDAVSYSGVLLVLGAVALLATYFPARRAIHVDPMTALRHE